MVLMWWRQALVRFYNQTIIAEFMMPDRPHAENTLIQTVKKCIRFWISPSKMRPFVPPLKKFYSRYPTFETGCTYIQ